MTDLTTKTKPTTLRARLESEQFRDQMAKALPKHMSPDRMIRVAATAIAKTPMLADCDQVSFFNAMLDLSQLGLEPDGRRAYLIPFNNRKKGIVECQLIIDYKGMVELILRTGDVSRIHADKVCENDEFEFNCGHVVRHRIDFRKPRGDAYAYYCMVTRKDGGTKCEVMTKDDIDAVRARSRSANSGPWVTDYDEMAKKTVAKRCFKWCEWSSEIRDAIEIDDKDYVEGRITARQTAAITTADDLTKMLQEPESDAEPSPPGALFDASPDAANA